MRRCHHCPFVQRTSSGNRRESLWMLYKSAFRSYQQEVISGGKLYDRYVTDFLNSHTYTDCMDAAGMNNHLTNLGIMTDLLKTRKDLVVRFFGRQKFSQEDFIDMQRLLDTTDASGTIPIDNLLPNGGNDNPYTFEYIFTPNQMSLIVHLQMRLIYFPPRSQNQTCSPCSVVKRALRLGRPTTDGSPYSLIRCANRT